MYQSPGSPPTLKRLIALLGAGYAIRLHESQANGDVICLEHPAHWQRVKEKSLFLRENGDVFGDPTDPNVLQISASEEAAFKNLVASTLRPTWWELKSAPFYNIAAWVTIAAILLAGAVLLELLVSFVKGLWV